MNEFSVIPRRLFVSSLPTGEHEVSCFVVFEGDPALISWRFERAQRSSAVIAGGPRPLLERERTSGRVLISAILPPGWTAASLNIRLTQGERSRELSCSAETYAQRGAFRLPLSGPVFVLGAHRIGDPHRTAWRIPSQQFAWDLLPLAKDGWRVLLGAEENLRTASFAAFGTPALAPAAGRVVRAVDGQPDQDAIGLLPAPETFGGDLMRAMGNHVVISHGDGVWSFLGHLRRGSVCVRDGDEVSAASNIGSVGASGNASGPHLHLHFMDGPDALTSSPLPVELDVEGNRCRPQAGELLSA